MHLKTILLALLLLPATTTAFGQGNAKDEQALKGLVENLSDAQVGYQPAAMENIFMPDYVEISPIGEVDQRDKVLSFYKPELKPPAGAMATVSIDEYSIRNYGKFAVVIVRFNYSMSGPDGKAMPPRSIRATFACVKNRSGWQIASAQYTGIRPPAAPKQ